MAGEYYVKEYYIYNMSKLYYEVIYSEGDSSTTISQFDVKKYADEYCEIKNNQAAQKAKIEAIISQLDKANQTGNNLDYHKVKLMLEDLKK